MSKVITTPSPSLKRRGHSSVIFEKEGKGEVSEIEDPSLVLPLAGEALVFMRRVQSIDSHI